MSNIFENIANFSKNQKFEAIFFIILDLFSVLYCLRYNTNVFSMIVFKFCYLLMFCNFSAKTYPTKNSYLMVY